MHRSYVQPFRLYQRHVSIYRSATPGMGINGIGRQIGYPILTIVFHCGRDISGGKVTSELTREGKAGRSHQSPGSYAGIHR